MYGLSEGSNGPSPCRRMSSSARVEVERRHVPRSSGGMGWWRRGCINRETVLSTMG